MGTQQHISKSTQAVSTASSAKLLQTRPFQNEHESENQQSSQLQTAESTASSFDLTTKTFSAPEPATASPAVPMLGLPLQAKLTIGEPNDKYEQEADRVAQDVVQRINAPDTPSSPENTNNLSTNSSLRHQPAQHQAQRQVAPKTAVSGFDLTTKTFAIAPQPTATPKPLLQPKLVPSESALQREVQEEEELQMKPLQRQTVAGGEASNELESTINRARSGGQSLDTKLQQSMGQAMGADFSGVKVHTDSTADTLNKSIQAKAFTTGQDLFFRQGTYQPTSRAGQELIAHELTHVTQQNRGILRRRVDTTPNQAIVITDSNIGPGPNIAIQRKIYKTVNNLHIEVSEKQAIQALLSAKISQELAERLVKQYSNRSPSISLADLVREGRQQTIAVTGNEQTVTEQNQDADDFEEDPDFEVDDEEIVSEQEIKEVIKSKNEEVAKEEKQNEPNQNNEQELGNFKENIKPEIKNDKPISEQEIKEITEPSIKNEEVAKEKVKPKNLFGNILNDIKDQKNRQLGSSTAKNVSQAEPAPGFGKHFTAESMGIETELRGAFVVAKPGSHLDLGFVKNKDGVNLFKVVKDQITGSLWTPPDSIRNDVKHPLVNQPLSTIEIVTYPQLADKNVAIWQDVIAARNWFIQELKKHISSDSCHTNPLDNLSGDKYTYTVSSKGTRVVNTTGTSVTPTADQHVTLGVNPNDLGTSKNEFITAIENAKWYCKGYVSQLQDADLQTVDPSRHDLVRRMYAYLKSVIEQFARIHDEVNIAIGDWQPKGPLKDKDGLEGGGVKNMWGIIPRTRPKVQFNSLEKAEQEVVKSAILKGSDTISDNKLYSLCVTSLLVQGNSVGSKTTIDDATIGEDKQQAALFELRTGEHYEQFKDRQMPQAENAFKSQHSEKTLKAGSSARLLSGLQGALNKNKSGILDKISSAQQKSASQSGSKSDSKSDLKPKSNAAVKNDGVSADVIKAEAIMMNINGGKSLSLSQVLLIAKGMNTGALVIGPVNLQDYQSVWQYVDNNPWIQDYMSAEAKKVCEESKNWSSLSN